MDKRLKGVAVAGLILFSSYYAYRRATRPRVPPVRPSATWARIKDLLIAVGGPLSATPEEAIRLDGVSTSELDEVFEIGGKPFRMVERTWYPILYNEDRDGYVVQILPRGDKLVVSEVRIRGRAIPLSKLTLPDGTEFMFNLSSCRSRLDGLPRTSGTHEFVAVSSRVFPLAGRDTSWVRMTPAPLYQRDLYLRNDRIVTFAAFRTPAAADSARAEVIPAP